MQHPDEGTIHSWLDGALSAEEAAQVEAHVKDCPECAAAVAEARGFIAASSRILTALDNAPRGVIPAAAPKKRVDPIVWRVAATLLVVAGGTFVVLRSQGRGTPIPAMNDNVGVSGAVTAAASEAPDSAESSAIAESAAVAKAAASPITIMGSPARPAGGSPQANTLSSKQPRAKVEALDKATTRQNGGAVAGGSAQNVLTGKAAAKLGAADISTANENSAAAATSPLASSAPAAAPSSQANPQGAYFGRATPRSANSAEARVQSPRALAPAPAGSVVALDAASEPQALKNVGTARQIGATTTRYEVAPGDTVTLTETMNVQLGSVVVTGMSTARTADQSTGKSAPAPATKSAAAPTLNAPDSQFSLQSALSASAQTARARENVQVANGVTTIRWTDPVTRNTMKLSGRMSPERLQQVKTRIERERAAEAAKKKP